MTVPKADSPVKLTGHDENVDALCSIQKDSRSSGLPTAKWPRVPVTASGFFPGDYFYNTAL
jgi:hypothetical protein